MECSIAPLQKPLHGSTALRRNKPSPSYASRIRFGDIKHICARGASEPRHSRSGPLIGVAKLKKRTQKTKNFRRPPRPSRQKVIMRSLYASLLTSTPCIISINDGVDSLWKSLLKPFSSSFEYSHWWIWSLMHSTTVGRSGERDGISPALHEETVPVKFSDEQQHPPSHIQDPSVAIAGRSARRDTGKDKSVKLTESAS